jgi:hypothetical protein
MHGLAAGLLAASVVLGSCRSQAADPREAVTDSDTPAELARLVTPLMPRLERLSGLDLRETLRVRRQSREDAREYVTARLAQEMPPDVLDGVRRTYVALGMLPDTLDLEALLLDLYTEQVLGYYDPGSRTLYVVDSPDAAALQPVLAHELVHALQDQHTDLDELIGRDRGNDRQTAAHAAMEGHAMLVMFAVLAEQATGAVVDPAALPSPATELGPALALQNEQFPVFGRAPLVIRETLLFPYLSGADFVHALWSSLAPLDRYPAPIDSLLPQSTEQVLRPRDRFIAERDDPIEVRFDDADGTADVVHEDTFGQFETGIFLEQHLGPDARGAADGWDGDRLRVVEHAGFDILQWISIWESGAQADRFADAVGRAARQRAGRRVSVDRVEVDGKAAVRVLDAPADAPSLPAAAARPVARLLQ